MTKILVRKTSTGAYTGFTCIGHSGFAQAGNDIVCASISVLVINAINSIEQFAKEKMSVITNEEEGLMSDLPILLMRKPHSLWIPCCLAYGK